MPSQDAAPPAVSGGTGPSGSPAGPSRRQAVVRGMVPILIAAATWGTTGTAASFAPSDASPLAVGAVTMGGGGLILLAIAGRSVRPLLRGGRQPLPVLALGAIAVAIYPLAFYTSMSLAGVAIGTVVTIGSSPVFAALIERLLDGTRLSLKWTAATALTIAGAALLVIGHAPPQDRQQTTTATVTGLALGLLAGLTYAGYSYAAARLMRRGAPSRPVMGLMFGGGAILLLPVLVTTGGPLLSTGQGLAVAGYLILVPMSLAYVLFGIGLARVRASQATTISLVEPVIAAVLSVVVVGEHLAPVAWGGMALVGLGLLLIGNDA
ncbi:DMT family transporter [Streptomyces sp. O3]